MKKSFSCSNINAKRYYCKNTGRYLRKNNSLLLNKNSNYNNIYSLKSLRNNTIFNKFKYLKNLDNNKIDEISSFKPIIVNYSCNNENNCIDKRKINSKEVQNTLLNTSNNNFLMGKSKYKLKNKRKIRLSSLKSIDDFKKNSEHNRLKIFKTISKSPFSENIFFCRKFYKECLEQDNKTKEKLYKLSCIEHQSTDEMRKFANTLLVDKVRDFTKLCQERKKAYKHKLGTKVFYGNLGVFKNKEKYLC